MCAQSVHALTVGIRGTEVAGETVIAPLAAAELDMLGHHHIGELKQLGRKYEPSTELARSGAPVSQVPKRVA